MAAQVVRGLTPKLRAVALQPALVAQRPRQITYETYRLQLYQIEKL